MVEGLFQSTPPRGRRHWTVGIAGALTAFQSTPPRGRRRATVSRKGRSRVRFNPRLRAGGDECRLTVTACDGVSIHASAREATCPIDLSFRAADVSIHASAREATRQLLIPSQQHRSFNPRLRAGGDDGLGAGARLDLVSIHASAREATSFVRLPFFLRLFQSTPPRGRRRVPRRVAEGVSGVSIHASAREATVVGHVAHHL